MKPDIWEVLSRTRGVTLRVSHYPARPAYRSTCRVISNAGERYETRDHPPRPERTRACITLYGEKFESVTFRLRKGETLEVLIWRALGELSRRERDGMPKPSPRELERRRNRKLLDKADGRPM